MTGESIHASVDASAIGAVFVKGTLDGVPSDAFRHGISAIVAKHGSYV